jgi:hypothetical protein
MDRLTLDPPTLLVAARAVGLDVAAEGDRLSVSGPKGAGGLARLLLERKAGILASLATEAAVSSRAGPPGGSPAVPPAPPTNMDLILDRVARRQGGRVVETDGGRVIVADAGPTPPAGSPAPAVAGPPVPPEWHGAPLDGHWRAAIAWWPVEWRQKWGDRAEVHQAAGIDWCLAEYWAWRETLRELDAFEAAGGVVEYAEPESGMSDEEALAAIDRAFDPHWWTRPPETESWHGDLGPRDVR